MIGISCSKTTWIRWKISKLLRSTILSQVLHVAVSDDRKSKSGPADQNLKWTGLLALALTLCGAGVQAQPAPGVHKIGFLSRDLNPAGSRAALSRSFDSFRQGLRDLGYVEGKNLFIEYRYADGKYERLRALAEELVRLKVKVIVTDTAAPARAAKQATATIPIVMAASGSDPVHTGLVASLAHPGGNVTGLTNLLFDLLGKRLELLKEVAPKATRFAFLDDDQRVDQAGDDNLRLAVKGLGVRLDRLEIKTANPDIDGAFRIMRKEGVGGFIASGGFLSTNLHRKRILQLAEQNRLLAVHPSEQWIDEGGLMYYGVNASDLYRRAATYVDKILKGTKPADLPVEQAMKFDFGVNLKAAKQIGVTIPPNVLVRAGKVIK